MLGGMPITALLGTVQPDRALAFYRDTLGLSFIADDGFALIFEAGGVRLRVSRVPAVAPSQYAVLAFTVPDIAAVVDGLTAKGVGFQRFPPFAQDERGVWTAPDGTKVAWFRDPDLNILSLVQHRTGV